MRNTLVFTCALIASGIGLMAPGLAQDAPYYPPSTYRPYGYYPNEIPAPSAGDATEAPAAGNYVPPPPRTSSAPPPPPDAAAGAPPPAVGEVVQAPMMVPGVPQVVVPAPVIVVPPRPASCGEYHFWNGFACVDARFNQPYLGPSY